MIKLITITYLIIYNIVKFCYWVNDEPFIKMRFKYYTNVIDDDWTSERVYKLQVKTLGLLWITVFRGDVDNEFRESDIESVKYLLESGEYKVKFYRLYRYTESEKEFRV